MDVNKKERVIGFIDGFNLYFGMKQNGSEFLWLNIQNLILSQLKPNQELIHIYYFTSRVRNSPEKEKRQNNYIEALETLDNFDIIYGHYQSHKNECRRCGHIYQAASEKMTDVNIAVKLLENAYRDTFDTAFLVTGDSDLVPPIKSVHKFFVDKRVFVFFPPNRFNVSVKNVSKGNMTIGRKRLKDAQFPNSVFKKSGYELKRPKTWI